MYVGSKHDLSSPGFDEIICFVRPKGGLRRARSSSRRSCSCLRPCAR
jgi:hypothetical protein